MLNLHLLYIFFRRSLVAFQSSSSWLKTTPLLLWEWRWGLQPWRYDINFTEVYSEEDQSFSVAHIFLPCFFISFPSDMCHGCLNEPVLQNKIQQCLTTNGKGLRGIPDITGVCLLPISLPCAIKINVTNLFLLHYLIDATYESMLSVYVCILVCYLSFNL